MEPWSALGSRLFLVFVMSGCSVLGWRRTPPVDWAAGDLQVVFALLFVFVSFFEYVRV